MSFVDSNGCRLYYERHGSGPAVVLLHGAGSNAATWWQQVPVLAERYTCLCLDYRGFGRSRAAARSLNWTALADDVLAVLEAEGIRRAALVCQSLGGGIGLRLALDHPQRVWAWISCGSPLGIDSPPVLDSVERHLQRAQERQVEQRALAPGFLAGEKALAFLYQQINAFNPMVFDGPAGELAARLKALTMGEALVRSERLREVGCPVLLIAGEHDPLVPPVLAAHLATLLPHARRLTIEGAGHSPYFERPEAFNAAVTTFLARYASSA